MGKMSEASVKMKDVGKTPCENSRYVGVRVCNNLPQPPPYIWKIIAYLAGPSCIIGMVSSLHPSFLHL